MAIGLSLVGISATTTAVAETGQSVAPDDVDPDGILQFGTSLVSGIGVHFDPIQNSSDLPNIYQSELVFGTLLRFNEDGVPEPWMAEGYEVVDPQTVTVTLRRDVAFTDGAAYDADAVAGGLMRTRFESADEGILARMDPGFKALETVDVVDPLTVEIHLDKPIAAAFVDSLASVFGAIPSPKQIAEDPESIDLSPVGAGPFIFEEYVPEQRISLRKNPDFFDADSWLLAGVDFVHTPLGPTQANALLAGTIDLNTAVPIESLASLEGDDRLASEVLSVRPATMLLCPTKPPFDNELVRQAIQVGIDRAAYNDLVYGGLGEPAYGLYPEGHPSYDPAVAELLAYDPDRARELLEEAGAPDVSFDLVTISTHNWGRQAEALQAQLADIGVTANIVAMDDVYTDWIEPQAPGAMFVYVPGWRVGGYGILASQVVEGGAQAYCSSPGDPEVAELIAEAVGLPADDPAAIELYRQANEEYIDSALHLPVIFEPIASVWNSDRIGGTPAWISVVGYPRPMLESIYIKQ